MKTFCFLILMGGSLLGCSRFHFLDLFNKKSKTVEPSRSQPYKEKEPIQEEALELAKKSIWEVSLFLNFQEREIDISQKYSKINIGIKPTDNLIHLGHGSGFFISPTLMITNFHVIDNAGEHIEILSNRDSDTSNNLIVHKMKVLKVSSIYDLALLESDKKSPYYLKLKKEALNSKRDSFFLSGYPGNRFIFTPVQYNSSHLNHKLIYFNRNTELGTLTGVSGGPFIDQNGEVVAVNQSGSDNLSIGVSSAILDNFLNGDNRDCSKISLANCIQQEWLFLNKAFKDGSAMAKYRMSVNISYDSWSYQKEKMNQLIENRQLLNKMEEDMVLLFYKKNEDPSPENQQAYQEILKLYKNEIEVYNGIVSEFNSLL